MSQRVSARATVRKAPTAGVAKRARPHEPAHKVTSVPTLLRLQQSIGNRATQDLLHAGVIQPKLRVAPPDDAFEREADRMADQVTRMPEPEAVSSGESPAVSWLCPGTPNRRRSRK